MRYFFKLAENVVVMPLMEQLARHSELWDDDRARTSFKGSPHAQVNDILLRCCNTTTQSLTEAYVDLEAADRVSMDIIRGAKTMALDVMALVRGSRLGRVVVTRLETGRKIAPHKDEGEYSAYYTRYHVVLQGLPGSMFVCGDESVHMRTGEIWWFDASAEHSVINNSKDDRIHMIVDVRIDP